MIRTLAALAILAMGSIASGAAAQPCPTPRDNGGELRATKTQLARAHFAQVIAGGTLDLAACAAVPGQGRVTRDPDFNVLITGADDRRGLEFRTEADCDTVLLVLSAAGWAFDDDGTGGPNARIRLADAAAGRYDVWVGTYGPASCKARLILQTFR